MNQESISLQTKQYLTNIWFDITKSYIKNASFRITDVKVLNKDTTNSSEQQNKDQNTTY